MRLLAVTLLTSVDLVGKTLMYVDTRQPVGQGRMSEYSLLYTGRSVVVALGDAYVVTPVENVRSMVPACTLSEFCAAESDPPVSVSSKKIATPSLKMDPLSEPLKIPELVEDPTQTRQKKESVQPEVYKSRKQQP